MLSNKVILDTNFLLIPYKYKLDIFKELKLLIGSVQFIISNKIIEELNSIAGRKGTAALQARFALKILDKYKSDILVVLSEKKVDDWIIDYSQEHRTIVCTDDIKLKNILRKNNIRVIMVKSKSKVDFA
ncbi:MAG: hypothetical protein PHU63_01090 [Candidatus ainarchaeum sp.]|nr:hypothetical protein [Candidatus ainarchaeum sp.]